MANKYVSPTGNDANDGTLPDDAHAWLTIPYAIRTAGSDDIINCKTGDYTTTPDYTVVRNSIASLELKTSISTVTANTARKLPVSLATLSTPVYSAENTQRYVDAVDTSRGVALIINGTTARYIEKCSDVTLQSFTTLVDIASDQPFKAEVDAAAGQGLTARLRSLAVLPNGNYLACMGYDAAWNATLWDNGAGYGSGQLYLSTNGGTTWTLVLKMQYGYVDHFGWSGISGNLVSVGEYRTLGANAARNVYLSSDYGVTWTTIYAPDDIASPYAHVHTTCILSPTQIVVSKGDGTSRSFFILTLSGGTWTAGSNLESMQPVSLVYDGTYIFCGDDGGQTGAVSRYNPTNGDYLPSLNLPLGTDAIHAYTGGNCVVLALKKIDGIFYAGMIDNSVAAVMLNGGIYSSRDGISWTCLYRIQSTHNLGVGQIAGVLHGKLWFTVSKANAGNSAMVTITGVIDVPKVVTANGIVAAKGLTNQITNPNNTNVFNADGLVWTGLSGTAIAKEATGGIYGDECLKVTLPAGASTANCGAYTAGGSRTFGTFPANGDRVTVTAWVKRGADWPINIPICFAFYKTDSADITVTGSNYQPMGSGWTKLTMAGLVTADWTGGTKDFRIHITVQVDGARGKIFYIDAIKVQYSQTRFSDFSAFTPGGTVRADESAAFSMGGLSKAFSSSFFWYPKSSFLEWGGDIKIATWLGANGSYINLSWKQSEKKFVITDGTDTVESTGTNYKFMFADVVKFCLATDGTNSELFIEDSLNGATSITGTAVNLTAPPVSLVCGTDYARSDYGTGIYAMIRGWNEVLADTTKAFNPDYGDATISGLQGRSRFLTNYQGIFRG